MTLEQRAQAYAAMFPKFDGSHLWVRQEKGFDVLYGIWLLGNDYRNRTPFYGAYPPRYLMRVGALFPDVPLDRVLHVFSGSVPPGPYTRLDVNPMLNPDVVGSVYNVGDLFPRDRFDLIYADPPYTDGDAKKYGTLMVDRPRTIAALATIAAPGAHLVWLDCQWPMHRKADWRTVGRIALVRSTNHRVRLVTIFQRGAAR